MHFLFASSVFSLIFIRNFHTNKKCRGKCNEIVAWGGKSLNENTLFLSHAMQKRQDTKIDYKKYFFHKKKNDITSVCHLTISTSQFPVTRKVILDNHSKGVFLSFPLDYFESFFYCLCNFQRHRIHQWTTSGFFVFLPSSWRHLYDIKTRFHHLEWRRFPPN